MPSTDTSAPDPAIRGLRVFLIQVRDVQEMADHELECVAGMGGLDPGQIERQNVAAEPRVPWARVERCDAVIIGGAAAHSAVDDDAYTPETIDLVKRLVDAGKPTFGTCWGHQFIARALGGEVIHDEATSEVGLFAVMRTEAASDDPVFGGLPDAFDVLMGHHDRVSALPADAEELAFSARCRYQAFRLRSAPVWGTQFHSELTPARLVERLERYPRYTNGGEGLEKLRGTLRPTPEATTIIPAFLRWVAGRR